MGVHVSALTADEWEPGTGVPVLPLIPQQTIATVAMEQLQVAGVLELPKWSKSLEGATAGASPILVNRLDRRGAYYLVSLVSKAGGALVGIDAYSGEVLFGRLNPSLKSVARLFAPVADLPPGAAVTRLVWTPSEASEFSPYFPFAEVRGLTGATSYVRIDDGRRFDSIAVRFPHPKAYERPEGEPPEKQR
jgi:hypothetical protein